jgi:hypothetical protein
MTTLSRRQRRQLRNDQYIDDVIRDGEVVRIPMMLADQAPMQPWPRPAPAPRAFARGYVSDAAGRITKHSTAAYYASRAAMQDEWKQYGPKASCCSGCASHDANISPPHSGELLPRDPFNPQPRREWPHGGYNDPSSNGGSQWPDPFRLQSRREGDECMGDDKRPGVLRRAPDGQLVCIPTGRDQAPSNIGPATAGVGLEWSQGGDCTCENGEPGLYVKQGDMLICQPRDFNGDAAQARRDAAYFDSVRNLENAWRSW